MNVQIAESWKNKLTAEFEKEYFIDLAKFVKSEYSSFQVFPKGNQIFNAFEHCAFEDLKVVVIG